MYRKIVWCYLIGLTLLDISLNTKLSAQGKSHGNGVSVHESLMEGISLQEWGKESSGEGAARGRGRAAPADAVALSPAALQFGSAALAAPHERTVTVTNTANETIHLASVAGSTPDFHASFFESKTLVPQANTTFTVVYLGRREGPVSAHLYIHTSKGVVRYPVSAAGVASAWRVWPLVGVRVPLNATLEPLLTLYNPTDATVQVSEVYSSGAWLGLRLPDGGDSAPRALWTLPPHASRPLVRLRIRPPHPHQAPRVAYIRIKGSMPGGGLVVGVEAGGAAPGEFLAPLQLRLGVRGARDPLGVFALEAGNSAAASVALDAEVWGATCGAAPPAPPAPPPPPPPAARPVANGAHAEGGARVALLRDRLDAHQPLAPAAQLTLDYGALWAGAERGAGAAEAWCAGWVRVGRAAAPYSVRVLRGTLTLTPAELHFVTAASGAAGAAGAARAVHAHNEFPEVVRIDRVHFPPEVEELFHTESLAPLVLRAGAAGAVARLRLRAGAGGAGGGRSLRSSLLLRTNLTDYSLPLLLYEGKLHFEWEWPGGASGALQLGALGTSSTRRVAARLHNRGVAPLCVAGLRARLPGATLELDPPPPRGQQRCVEPGASTRAVLTVVAPARESTMVGVCSVSTPHADTEAPLSLTAVAGRVSVPPVLLDGAAPYVWARAPLVLENSMAIRMRVAEVAQSPPHEDAALSYILPEDESRREVAEGRSAVGELVYAAEAGCAPRCSTGLEAETAEGAAWLERGAAPAAEALAADAALRAERLARFAGGDASLAVLVHTTRALALAGAVRVRRAWPALAARGAGRAGLAGVGGAAPLRVRVRNPAARPLLLQARVAAAEGACAGCEWSPASFALGEWRAVRGGAAGWPRGASPPPYVLLEPDAEIEFALTFSPTKPTDLAAVLYLRNNLTILENVPLSGRGAHPSFELAGRKPNSTSAILLEAGSCGVGGAGTVRRTVLVRNTGAVPVRLRDWRLGGAPCVARGFRLQPCAALDLAPNETRALTVAFTPDWTRARAAVALSVRAGAARADFGLAAAAPARLVARCAPAAPRPPFEPALRSLGDALALLALAAAVALAAADAERALRRHRSAREPQPPRAPLDLRALARADPPPPPPPRVPPPPPPRRRRTPRPRGPPLDPAAERRAFELWRAEVSRRADESRSSEEGEAETPAAPPPPPAAPRGDASSSSPDSSPPPRERRDSYGAGPRRRERGSTASDSSAGSERSEPEDESPPPAPHDADGSPARGDAPRPEAHTPPHDLDREPDASGTRGGVRARAAARSATRARPRSGSVRAGARKERLARRRERASPPPPRASPPRAPAALRWGASWSSVVSRGAAEPPPHGPAAPAPLAPIGSDVRRRAASHSLFYYGAAPDAPPPPEPEYAPWPAPPPPPARARAPAPPRRDFLEEPANGAFRSLESVWGASMEPHPAAAAWLWGGAAGGGGALRPPPGFPAPPAVRSFDPFHSLASIWTPAALDWRRPAGDADAEPPARDVAAPAAASAPAADD